MAKDQQTVFIWGWYSHDKEVEDRHYHGSGVPCRTKEGAVQLCEGHFRNYSKGPATHVDSWGRRSGTDNEWSATARMDQDYLDLVTLWVREVPLLD